MNKILIRYSQILSVLFLFLFVLFGFFFLPLTLYYIFNVFSVTPFQKRIHTYWRFWGGFSPQYLHTWLQSEGIMFALFAVASG